MSNKPDKPGQLARPGSTSKPGTLDSRAASGDSAESAKSDRSVEAIGRQAGRRQAARDRPAASPLRGFSTFGMVGWSVAVPTVGGAFLGLWLDRVAPQGFSWTLALILGGLAIGLLIAWAWIDKENSGT